MKVAIYNTQEAIENIVKTTVNNITAFEQGNPIKERLQNNSYN